MRRAEEGRTLWSGGGEVIEGGVGVIEGGVGVIEGGVGVIEGGVGAIEGCYLLHFGRPVYGAQHYLGWSVDVSRRVRQHMNGQGARLVRQALRASVSVELVRVWVTHDSKQERVLKRRGAPKDYCPLCSARKR
jgi:putative endonuclease